MQAEEKVETRAQSPRPTSTTPPSAPRMEIRAVSAAQQITGCLAPRVRQRQRIPHIGYHRIRASSSGACSRPEIAPARGHVQRRLPSSFLCRPDTGWPPAESSSPPSSRRAKRSEESGSGWSRTPKLGFVVRERWCLSLVFIAFGSVLLASHLARCIWCAPACEKNVVTRQAC